MALFFAINFSPQRRTPSASAVICLLLLLAVTIFVCASNAFALDKFWIGPPGGNFSDDANWSISDGTCGVAPDTTAPGVGDSANFDGGCNNDITIDVSVSVDSIYIWAGYAGTVTQASGVSITTTSALTQEAGSFVGSDASIDVGGVFSITGGSFSAPSATLSLGGGFYSNDGTIFDAGTGTVIFSATGDVIGRGTGTAVDDSNYDFNNLIVNPGVVLTVLATELEVDGTLTISAGGTLQLDEKRLDLNGTLSNLGTLQLDGTQLVEIGSMDTDSGLVRYVGASSTVIPSSISSYYDLDFDESGASNPTYTLPATNIAVNGNLYVTDGTLAFSAANNLAVSGTTTVAASGSLTNTGGGDLTLGGSLTNSGTISFDSSGGGAGDADSILIRSTSAGTRRNWQGAGSFTLIDVDAQDQSATGGTPAFVNVSSGTDSGNNLNWVFGADLGLSLSGTVYNGKAEGGTLAGKGVKVAHYDGSSLSQYTLTTNGGGAFSISNILLSSGDVLVFYLNDEAEEGTLAYVSDGASHGDLKLYQNANLVHSDTGTVSNAMLSAADDGDDDIKYQVTGANVVFDPLFEVYVVSGTTYTPGGIVTGGAFDINGTLNMGGNDITVSGNWDATGGVYTSGANTTTFNGTTTLISGGVDVNHDFNNMTLVGDVTLSTNNMDVNGNVTIDATRTFDTSGLNINIAGDWTNNGIFIPGSGTVTFDGATSLDAGGTASGTKYFNNVTVSGSVTLMNWGIRLDGDMSISGALINASAAPVWVAGDWSNTGSFTSGLQSVYFTGTGTIDAGGSGLGVDDSSADFQSAVFNGGTYLLVNTELEVDGTLYIYGGATLDLDGQALDLNGTLDNNGTLRLQGGEAVEISVMDIDSGTVHYDGTVSITMPSGITSYYSLLIDESGASDPIYTLPAVDVTVVNALAVSDGILAFSAANNLSVGGFTLIASELRNTGTGDFIIGWSISNTGAINFDSSGGGAGDADSIQIRSSVPGTRRNWQGAGTYSLIDVDVQDQTAIGGTPSLITTSSSTNSGNNVNWVFDAAPDTLSGVVYNGKAEAGTLAGKALRLVHSNGGVTSTFDTMTDGSGGFSFGTIDLQSGDPLVIFLNDEAEAGNLLYISDGGSHGDLKLYQNEIAIRTDAGTGLTNAQMQLVDDGDGDIHYTVTGGNATIESGYEVFIFGGSTFLPGGAVTGGAFDINGTFDAAGNDVTVGGAWDATGGIYISGLNTTTFTGSGALISGGIDDAHDFHHMTISGTGSVGMSTDDLDVDGDFSVVAGGVFDKTPTLDMYISGDYTVSATGAFYNGTAITDPGLLIFDGTTQLTTGGTDGSHDFINITVVGTVTPLANNIYVGNLDIQGGGVLSNTNNLNIDVWGDWDNSGTFASGTGTVTFLVSAAHTISGGGTGAGVDDVGADFNNLVVSAGSLTLVGSELEIDGTLTVSAGTTLLLAGQDLDLNGTLVNDGTLDLLGTEAVEIGVMDTNSGLVRYTGTTSATIPAAFATYFNVEFDESGILDPVWTLPAVDVAVNGTLAITDGTLAFSAANNLTVTGTTTVGAAGIFLNEGDGDFTIGATVTNWGTITFDSSGNGPGDADNILIRSTTTARRDWAGSGTFTMIDVDVNRMTAISGTPTGITVDSGTNSGRCINWYFDGLPDTISGVAYTSKAEAATLNSRDLRMRHEAGGITSNYDTTTDGSGNFTFTAVDMQPGDAIIIFLNGEPVEGNLVYVSDGNDVLDLKFYQDAIGLRDDSGGTGITNTDLLALDNGDSDILYAVTGSDIVFQSAFEAFIFSGTTYLPGGTVTGDAFDINGTFDAAGNNVTVSGNWDATGGIYTSGANTTTFNGTTTLISGGTDADHDFNNVTLSGDVTLSTNAIDINGNLLINVTRTLTTSGQNINLAGDYTNSGTFVGGAGTVTFDGTSNVISGGVVAAKQFSHVIVDGSVILVTDHVWINGDLTINGTISNVNNRDINLNGSWDNNGTFISGTGIVYFWNSVTVDAGGTGVGVDDSTKDFHDIIIMNGDTVSLSGSELEVDNTLTISAGGSLRTVGLNLDLNGTLLNDGTLELLGSESVDIGVMDSNSGLVKYTGLFSTVIPAAITAYYNLEFDEAGASDPIWTLPAANIAVNGTLNVTDGTLNYSAANNLTVTGVTTVAAAGAITNSGTGDLTLGSTVANAGTISFDSSGGGAGDADSIQIRSTVGGTQRNWQGAGTFTMLDVNAQDQTAIGGTPAFINVSSGTDAGNNVNWMFAADAGLTLSGVAYTGKAEAGTLNGKAIRVAHYNGATRSYYTITTDGAGAFSLSNAMLTAGDVLIFYLNDVVEEGLLIYVSDGAGHADLKMYQNANYIRNDHAAALTNAMLSAADDGDDDIKYLVTGGNIVFEAAFEVFISNGTYAPGGTVTGGAFDINGTLDAEGNNVTVSGNWDATGGVYHLEPILLRLMARQR